MGPSPRIFHTMSPLLMAVLFAGQGVVDALKKAGSKLNCWDTDAVLRLRRARLEGPLRVRMLELGLDADLRVLKRNVHRVLTSRAHAHRRQKDFTYPVW